MPIIVPGGSVTPPPPAGSGSFEVYWKDHRNLNGYTRINNELLRYTLHNGDQQSLIEVYQAGGWATCGSLQIGAIVPLRSYNLLLVSPEETAWEEWRHDISGGSGLFRIQCRIRRGSRIIECQLTAISGALGTTGIALVPESNNGWVGASSTDSTGIIYTKTAKVQVPGWVYLTNPAGSNAATASLLPSGISVATGATARFGILVGTQDTQLSTLGSAGYAGRWAAYNRSRIKQRILVGG